LIRLIATDLDGTLLRPDGSISPRTRAALAAADDAGLLIAFVTGRPPRWLDDVVESSGHRGVAVGANGAVLYDLAAEQVVSVHPLEPAAVAVIGADLRAAFPAVQFAVEYLDGFATEPGYLHDWAVNPPYDRRGNPIPPPPVGRLDEIAQRPLLKLLAKDDGADVDEYLLRAEEVLADRGTVTHSSSFGLLEIAAPGVTKASGLAELAASHGIGADEVVAIGDMPNDVPMLVWAGTSYAVANAHASAKEAADAVVGSNEEDAVALVIERLLGEQALP
jgi:Cof subfamily protein (haloacid dehalogenase superfamily)